MIFLDANVLLELLLPDRPKTAALAIVLSKLEHKTAISALTVHLVMHFGRQAGINDELIHAIVTLNTMLASTEADYAWAVTHEHGRDFEDALQVGCAINNGCTQFLTLDKALIKQYQADITMITA